MSETYGLGVDLGTTYTAAALWRDGRAEAVPLGTTSLSVPSVLFLREDDVLLVGDAAVRRGIAEPERVARQFKRRFGDDVPLLIGGREATPAELAGHLLRWVVDTVSEQEGGPPDHVTLTHPATWEEHRTGLMTEVAEVAGLTGVGLVAEPVAAAAFYASTERLNPGALLVVYDLGGGTFDATVVRKTRTGFEVEGRPMRDPDLGGVDFDQAVMDHVAAVLGVAWRKLDLGNPTVLAAVAQVREHAVAAKEQLSSDTEASVPVALPGTVRHVRITRGEFESAIRMPVLRTIEILGQAIEAAGATPSDIRTALLVGGSSRIPLVSRLVSSQLGLNVGIDAHPKFSVCLGAAILAGARLEMLSPPGEAKRAAEPVLTRRLETQRAVLAGRYEITSPVVTGSMEQVWRARDRALERVVLAKVLHSDFTGDPGFVARFRDEVRRTAALSHPNIASIYDYGKTQDERGAQLAFLIMELVEGKSLVTILHETGKLPVDWTLHVLRQAADGLSAAHAAGVVHRNIKPDNLIVRPDGLVKLTDFGFARARDATPLARTGIVVGTTQYLSPEQAQGFDATAASDVYSLGVVGYECLTGFRPFEGNSHVAIALAHINRPLPPLPSDIPPAVRALVERAVAKEPAQRFQDGAAFAKAVRQVAIEISAAPAATTERKQAGRRAEHGLRQLGGSVFLCHSSGDKERVRNLYRQLTRDGVDCWFDEEDLLPGQDWDREIRKAIRACRYVVACLSENSISRSGYVQKELKNALDVADEQPDGSIFLIPVRLEPCEVPERLQRLHWVDLFASNGYDKLLRVLKSASD